MSCDNRQFLRVPAGESFATAIARLGGRKTLTCEVVNKSAGGYGIAVTLDHGAAFPPGRILVLEIDELVVQVKVAHVDRDPEQDRYLVGLECIVELEDKTLSRQPQVSWFSALRSSSGHGVGGTSGPPRDVVMAVLLCCSLMAFTFLPALIEQLNGNDRSRGSWNQSSFNLSWKWPAGPRASIQQANSPAGPNTAVRRVATPVPGRANPAANPVTPRAARPLGSPPVK